MRFRLLLLFLPALLPAQSLAEFEKKVTAFTLENGLKFLIVERHEAPVVSFHTYVNAGSVDDPSGRSGLAHMFEHMAFKGTASIGSKNWAAERKALDAIEAIYDRLQAERDKGFRADARRIALLEDQLKEAVATADKLVEPQEYDRIIESSGGVGLNAGTSEDSTTYFVSYPANRMELWFLLESERFLNPVFREFYKERDVVREERRMRVESSPQGQLVEALLSTAFAAHPYRVMPGGWASDIEGLRRGDAERFFKTYYSPANMLIGIAGDVHPAEARRLAERYFGRLPRGTGAPRVRTVEPPQKGERRVAVESAAQPFVAMAYKRPDQHSPDDLVLDVLSEVLSGGRTGLIYKELVRDQRISLGAAAEAAFPGGKYPPLFLFFSVPAPGHTVEENEKAIYAIVERIQKEKPEEAAIQRVRTKLRASLIRRLDSNAGLAAALCFYEANFGDWRKLFTDLGEYEKITAEDVQRVARKYLVASTRTVAFTFAPQSEGGAK
jgi:predicted Zn-dependent peptidase